MAKKFLTKSNKMWQNVYPLKKGVLLGRKKEVMMIPLSEVKTKLYLQKAGYDFVRSGRSHGVWDFIAFNAHEILFIQSKLRQGPDSVEWVRLRAFSNYPKAANVKRQVWLWQKGKSEPRVINIEEGD